MNRIIGASAEAKDTVKEAIGTTFGDAGLQAEGSADITKRKVQGAIVGPSDAVRDALKK